MTLQLEEGKFYRDGEGHRRGPMRRGRRSENFWEVGYGQSHDPEWHSDGKNLKSPDLASAPDIIAEWTESGPGEVIEVPKGADASGPYVALRQVLDAAYEQSAEGKGKERHANERPFTEQPIMVIGRSVGVGFAAGQVQKKIGEAVGMSDRGEHDAAYREALGAIVYAAAAALLFLEKKKSD
jgi:hypothetical protein